MCTLAPSETNPGTFAGIGGSMMLALVCLSACAMDLAAQTVTARRPGYPYRVWYSAPGFASDPSLYPNMTIVHAGSASPQFAESKGKSYLQWAFGTNINNTNIPGVTRQAKYYSDRFPTSNRTWNSAPGFPYQIVIAGAGFDEWVYNGTYPASYDWVHAGLVAGRSQYPDTFSAIWAADATKPQLFSILAEDAAEVVLMQGYDVTGPGLGINFNQAIIRMENFAERGLGRKIVMGLGHMTDAVSFNNQSWDEARLRSRMEEVKRKFPGSPGISFFPGTPADQSAFNEIVRTADALSGEYWPDLPLPDGLYSITPQTGTAQRLDAEGSGTENGTKVVAWRSGFPNDTLNQKWRFTHLGAAVYKIQPAYSSTLCLDVASASDTNGAKVQLYADNGTNAQKWRLSKAVGGYRLSPLSGSTRYLQLSSSINNTQARIWTSLADQTQVFALAPEVSPQDQVPPLQQAETAILAGGTDTSSGNVGHSGGGYARLGGANRSITFQQVDGGPGGIRGLCFRYALGSNIPATTVALEVNGTHVRNLTFHTTGGDWRKWETRTTVAGLLPGTNNTINLRNVTATGLDLDKLTIVHPCYGPDEATLGGGATSVATPWGGDGGHIELPAGGATAHFSAMDGGAAHSPGKRGLRFRYANGSGAPQTVVATVNNIQLVMSLPATASWSEWQDLTIYPASLVAEDSNELALVTAGFGDGIRLQSVTIDPGYNPVDFDGDGLRNQIEFDAGTNPHASDTDGDGCPDVFETKSGSDPLDPADYVRLTPEMLTGDIFAIRWPSLPGTDYQVERLASSGEWNVISSIQATGTLSEYLFPMTNEASAILRVRLTGY